MDNFLLISLFLILSISPFIVAHYTKHKRKVLILVLGLLTGWTIIGSIALNTYALLSSMKFKKLQKKYDNKKDKKMWIQVWIFVAIGIIIISFWNSLSGFQQFGLILALPFVAAGLYIFDFIFDIKKK